MKESTISLPNLDEEEEAWIKDVIEQKRDEKDRVEVTTQAPEQSQ